MVDGWERREGGSRAVSLAKSDVIIASPRLIFPSLSLPPFLPAPEHPQALFFNMSTSAVHSTTDKVKIEAQNILKRSLSLTQVSVASLLSSPSLLSSSSTKLTDFLLLLGFRFFLRTPSNPSDGSTPSWGCLTSGDTSSSENLS